MHFINGCVYLQALILSMNNSKILQKYIKPILKELISKTEDDDNIFSRPLVMWITALFWHYLDETIQAIADLDIEFKIYSMLIAHTKDIRFPAEHKIMVVGLINYLEAYETPSIVPIVDFKS